MSCDFQVIHEGSYYYSAFILGSMCHVALNHPKLHCFFLSLSDYNYVWALSINPKNSKCQTSSLWSRLPPMCFTACKDITVRCPVRHWLEKWDRMYYEFCVQLVILHICWWQFINYWWYRSTVNRNLAFVHWGQLMRTKFWDIVGSWLYPIRNVKDSIFMFGS